MRRLFLGASFSGEVEWSSGPVSSYRKSHLVRPPTPKKASPAAVRNLRSVKVPPSPRPQHAPPTAGNPRKKGFPPALPVRPPLPLSTFVSRRYLSVVPWVGVHVRYPLSALVVFLSLMSQERPTQGGGGGTHHVMHGRSRMTIDPRIPPMPRQSTSGFHRPGRYCLHQARSSVRCWASSMEDEPHPSKMTAANGWICPLLRPIVPGYSNK